MLDHVRQHDTPEDDIRGLAPISEDKHVARPVLLGHLTGHHLEARPAFFDFRCGLVAGHGRVIPCIHGVDIMRGLPFELERLFAGERER